MVQPPRAGDFAASLVLVALAGGIWWESTRWPAAVDFAGDPLLMPRALAGLMCVVAMVLTWRALRRPAGTADAPAGNVGRVIASIAATVGLGLLLEPLGLIATAFVYLLVLQRLTGATILRACLVAIAVPLVIWAAFRLGLNVPLPSGSLWD